MRDIKFLFLLLFLINLPSNNLDPDTFASLLDDETEMALEDRAKI